MVKKKRKAGLNLKKRKEQALDVDNGGREKCTRKPTVSASTASTSQAATPAPNPAAQTVSRYSEPTYTLSYPIDADSSTIVIESLCTSGVHTTLTISLATVSHSHCILLSQHSLPSDIIQ